MSFKKFLLVSGRHKLKVRYLVGFIILFFPFYCCADTYKWTDPTGIVHYSDIPQQGAVSLKLPTDQSYHVAAVAVSPSEKSALLSKPVYTNLQITQPANNYTYVDNEQGDITVAVAIKPALQAKDKVQIILDGKIHATSLTITNIDRGQHTLQAQIIDEKGKVLMHSDRIVFNMQRPILPKSK